MPDRELEALLTQRAQIVALDLAGDERNWPAERFTEHFARARSVGWGVTVHPDEAGSAASIWSALRDLGATRIGHGTRAIDDPALLTYLAEHRIGVEMNITHRCGNSWAPASPRRSIPTIRSSAASTGSTSARSRRRWRA